MTYEELLQKNEKELANYYKKKEEYWLKQTAIGPVDAETKKQFDAVWNDVYKDLVAVQHQQVTEKLAEDQKRNAPQKIIRESEANSKIHEQELKDKLGNAYYGTEQDRKDAMRQATARERGDKASQATNDKFEKIRQDFLTSDNWFEEIGGTPEMLEDEPETTPDAEVKNEYPKQEQTNDQDPGPTLPVASEEDKRAALKQETIERLQKMQDNFKSDEKEP